MEVDLDAGVSLELATKQDIMRALRRNEPFVEKIQAGFSGQTDANGNLVMRVYDVTDGKEFSLFKALLIADGFTPASPYVNAAAWCGIYHGNPGNPGAIGMGNLADFAPSSPGGQIFPSTFEYGSSQAPEFRAPDNVGFGLISGPPSTNITILLFGELRSITIRARPETPINTSPREMVG